jgi:cytidine deaminase
VTPAGDGPDAELLAAATAGERPAALLLVAPRTSGALTMPCGACLQVALEWAGPTSPSR